MFKVPLGLKCETKSAVKIYQVYAQVFVKSLCFEITPNLLETVIAITWSVRGRKPPTIALWNLPHNAKRKGRAEKAEVAKAAKPAKAAKADALR